MNEQYYYSFSAKGFFWLSEEGVTDKNNPDDLKPISEEEHAALFLGQEQGKFINHTKDGPVLVNQPDYTPEQLVEMANNKKSNLMQLANAAIAPLQDAADLDIASDEESAALLDWKKYRVMLSRVKPEEAPGISWPTAPTK